MKNKWGYALSLDGSAFDSNQKADIQEACQGPLWEKVIEELPAMLDEANARSPHKLAKEIAAHLRSTTNQLFAHFPGINAEWNSR